MSERVGHLTAVTDSRVLAELCQDLLKSGIPVRFCAPGRSMGPTIRDGDEIEVAPLGGRRIGRGTVVLYRGWGGVIAHRVLAVREALSVRGDASFGSGESVSRSEVLGVVVAVRRNGRWRRLDGVAGRRRHAYALAWRLAVAVVRRLRTGLGATDG
ncbi:MAG: S26 family signal peptidase [Thermoanaerobaculaceae bacterium]